MKWRILPLSQNTAFMNMAIDEVLLEGISKGSSDPTIRFYTWKPSAVSIGRFQSMEEEVNLGKCRELQVDCVRRLTGGGAVYHDQEGEITYSLIAPDKFFGGIRESYGEICLSVIKGLSNIGIKAEFAPINDILVGGKKISGNAQTRKSGVLLQHGTILYKTNIQKMFSVLRVSKEKISDKMIKNVEERVTSVSQLKTVSLTELYDGLMRGFTEGKEFEIGKLSKQELDRAKELSARYAGSEWSMLR